MSRKVTILRRLSLRDGAHKPSSNTSIEREGQMRKNLRVLDLKPTTCRHLLILCGLVVLLAGGPYSAEAQGGKNKQEAISMDVELDGVVGENFIEFIEGDTSLLQSPDGYFPGDEMDFVDSEEQCPCYGSRFAKDTVGGAYFGNCLKDFLLEGEDGEMNTSDDILIIRGHFLIYSDKKTKEVVGVRPSLLDSNGNRYSGGFLSVSPASLPPAPDGGVVVDVDAVGVQIRLDSGVGRNKQKSFLAGTINIGSIRFTPKPPDTVCATF